MTERAVWVVRSGRAGKRTVDFNLRESVVTLGWGDWVFDTDVADHGDKDDLDDYFNANFAEFADGERRTARHEILRFRDRIEIGDAVVLPLTGSEVHGGWIAVGEVSGPMVRDPNNPTGAYLYRRVNWTAETIDESDALPDLVSSIKQPQQTVFQPRKAPRAAERLLHLARHGTDPGSAAAADAPVQVPMFVLTWNPDIGRLSGQSNEQGYQKRVNQSAAGERFVTRWSTGQRKHVIAAGHDVVLLLQEGPKSGIKASGVIATGTTLGKVWTDKAGQNWVKVEWDRWVPIEDRLPRQTLNEIAPWFRHRIQSSGQRVPDDQALALTSAWDALHPPVALSGDEADVISIAGARIPEGAKNRVEVNRYERDPEARRLCLEHYGYVCQVCDIRFEERYGEIGRGFIHVHHLIPLGDIDDHDNHIVDPVVDLRPVCPNCHAMLHRPKGKTLTVTELVEIMKQAGANSAGG
ncbi:hypothetical protein [Candidatus Poriferisodalis sp.]|uniref:hypothetical protein n=1 Tax=Candidatus Poriferisodalis sp. TaxID=3101277 RepID=UPI003B02AA3D